MIQTHNKCGSALIITMVVMIMCIAITGTLMLVAASGNRQVQQANQYEKCYGILQTGIAQASKLYNERRGNGDHTVDIYEDALFDSSTDDNPVLIDWTSFGNTQPYPVAGRYKVMHTRLDLGKYRVDVLAEIMLGKQSVRRRAVATIMANGVSADATTETNIPGAPFYHAVYAGSANINGTNPLNLGGTGTKADRIQGFPPNSSNYLGTYPGWNDGTIIQPGDVYGGKKLDIHQDAYIAPGATARSGGVITETSSNVDGVNYDPNANPPQTPPGPTQVAIQAGSALNNPTTPNYNTLADVVYIIPSDFTKTINADSGTASVVNYTVFNDMVNDPRSMFLKNPTSHNGTSGQGVVALNGDTDRNDFFLDDMFHPGQTGPRELGSGGQNLEPNYDGPGYYIDVPSTGNNKIYYIDGNLWLHNHSTYSFQIRDQADGTGTKVTFVAKGNIYLSDNLTYQNLQKDAIALIAIKDARDYPDQYGNPPSSPTRESSGDLRFGDPAYGTTARFAAYMYAENDYYSYNTNNNLYIYGNMTAGNEIKVSNGVGQNRKSLVIDYDGRIQLQQLSLPGLPTDSSSSSYISYTTSHLQYYYTDTFALYAFYETGINQSGDASNLWQ
jgi:hypothetical protein